MELLVGVELESHLRGQWQELSAAGLPSQGRNRAPSNRPHVTVGVATAIYTRIDKKLGTVAGRRPIPGTHPRATRK